jgi:hypothetical protein
MEETLKLHRGSIPIIFRKLLHIDCCSRYTIHHKQPGNTNLTIRNCVQNPHTTRRILLLGCVCFDKSKAEASLESMACSKFVASFVLWLAITSCGCWQVVEPGRLNSPHQYRKFGPSILRCIQVTATTTLQVVSACNPEYTSPPITTNWSAHIHIMHAI